jgi:hypothetical protein
LLGDYVRLSLEHLTLPVWAVAKCHKLRGKYFGAFQVVAVHSPIAIELRLPSWLHSSIHPVFHAMYLKPSTTASADRGMKQLLQDILNRLIVKSMASWLIAPVATLLSFWCSGSDAPIYRAPGSRSLGWYMLSGTCVHIETKLVVSRLTCLT